MATDCKRARGQFFTPLPVVDFMLDALEWLAREDCASAQERRMVDPACGDGVFLRRALERRLARPGNVFGLDSDAGLSAGWRQGGLGKAARLQVGDGLLAESLAGQALEEAFDWVVGNPPYGGEGLKRYDDATLAQIISRYELCSTRYGGRRPTPRVVRPLPIEVLFVERFLRLCRPEGLIAIILPVGIFANDRWRYVREWLLQRITLHAVVGLPRTTFRGGGITAKACVAIARKRPAPEGHEVMLAEVERIGGRGETNELGEVLRLWQDGVTMARPECPWAREESLP